MPSYCAGIIGLTGIASRPLPTTPIDPALGIELPHNHATAYNGHFGCVCYHPIFVFNQFGDCEGAMLRPGNVHSAHDWRHVLEPILARYERTGVRRYFKFYNARRPHSSLGGMTPDQFFDRAPVEYAAA